MTNLRDYIKQQSVYSKLSENPIVGQWEHLKLVFIHGYPMTLRGFYMMTSKAIFGATLPIYSKVWAEFDAETKLLCEGLGHKLEEGREALSVVEGIRAATKWSKETTSGQSFWNYDHSELYGWIESVELGIAQLNGITLPDQQLQ